MREKAVVVVDVLILKECLVIKKLVMKSPKRDILVVVRNNFIDERAIEQEVESLNEIFRNAESNIEFCKAHELVDRNRITGNTGRILKMIRFVKLPSFRFFINKN